MEESCQSKTYCLFSLDRTIIYTICKTKDSKPEKVKELEFTVVEDADVPKKLMEIINEEK